MDEVSPSQYVQGLAIIGALAAAAAWFLVAHSIGRATKAGLTNTGEWLNDLRVAAFVTAVALSVGAVVFAEGLV
jgi:hypothetical protein